MYNEKVCCSDAAYGKASAAFLQAPNQQLINPYNAFVFDDTNINKRQVGGGFGGNGAGGFAGDGRWGHWHGRRRGQGGRRRTRGRLLTPVDGCGVTKIRTTNRIVGGTRSKPGI